MGDVKLANICFYHSLLIYQTFVTNLHRLRVELRCKLKDKIALCDRVFNFVTVLETLEHIISTSKDHLKIDMLPYFLCYDAFKNDTLGKYNVIGRRGHSHMKTRH